MSEVKPVENISKNQQSFLQISPIQKEVLPSHKLLESFRIKGRKSLTEKLPESTKPSRFVSHRARMSGEFESRKDSQSTKFELRCRIFIKLSFRKLWNSKLSGLHAFDNMTIIH